MIIFE